MKRTIRTKVKRGSGRDLFDEVSEGMERWGEGRQGKQTLRTHESELKSASEIPVQKSFEEIVEPIAQSFDESGMSEEDLDELITQTRKTILDQGRGKKRQNRARISNSNNK